MTELDLRKHLVRRVVKMRIELNGSEVLIFTSGSVKIPRPLNLRINMLHTVRSWALTITIVPAFLRANNGAMYC